MVTEPISESKAKTTLRTYLRGRESLPENEQWQQSYSKLIQAIKTSKDPAVAQAFKELEQTAEAVLLDKRRYAKATKAVHGRLAAHKLPDPTPIPLQDEDERAAAVFLPYLTKDSSSQGKQTIVINLGAKNDGKKDSKKKKQTVTLFGA